LRRLLIGLTLSAALSGCATNSAVVDAPNIGPVPNFESIIADNLRARPKTGDAPPVQGQLIFTANKHVDKVEISDLRRTLRTDLYGWAWQTCIRASVEGVQHSYAVFVAENRVIDSRMALEPDQCDQRHYTPLKIAQAEPQKSNKRKPK
jgi:hypothetical protein